LRPTGEIFPIEQLSPIFSGPELLRGEEGNSEQGRVKRAHNFDIKPRAERTLALPQRFRFGASFLPAKPIRKERTGFPETFLSFRDNFV